MKKSIVRSTYGALAVISAVFFALLPSVVEAGTIVRAPTNQGLVGYFTFDKDDIKINALDRSGLGNNGVLSGFTSTSTANVVGRMGQALNFDGSNDQVSINPIASRIASGAFSVSLWFNPASTFTGANRQILFLLGDASSDNDVRICLGGTPSDSCNSPTGQLCLGVYTGGGWADACASQTTWPAGSWVHVVGTFSPTGGQRLYVNAVSSGSNANTSRGSSVTTQSSIGYNPIGGVDGFLGSIDDVRIYNRALTAAEVSTLYGATAAQRTRVATTQGLVGYWRFEEGSGAQAGDGSGNQNHGTLTNMANPAANWVSGKRGTALSFDGTDDYISLNFKALNTYSYTAWIKPLSSSANIIEERIDNGDKAMYTSSNQLAFGWWNLSIPGATVLVGGSIRQNAWNFVVGTWDGTNRRIYVDGIDVGSDVPAAQSGIGALNWKAIGRPDSGSGWAGGLDNPFKGLIDDVRIYNRALSADEVKAMYNEGAVVRANVTRTPVGLEKGLVGHWTFDGQDVVNTTAYDKSGSGNRGTLTNGPVRTLGRIGQALSFDGSDDYVTTTNLAGVAVSTPFSLSAWVYRVGATGNIVATAKEQSPWDGVWFTVNASAQLNLLLQGTDTNRFGISGNTAIPVSTWTFVTATYDGTGGVNGMKIYVNGSQQSTSNIATQAVTTMTDRSWVVGASQTPVADFFPGKLDDIRIYNRTLSADEVKQLYNLGR